MDAYLSNPSHYRTRYLSQLIRRTKYEVEPDGFIDVRDKFVCHAKSISTTKLGQLKKHLGVMYNWQKDEEDSTTIVVAPMKDYQQVIVKDFEKKTDRSPKGATTLGFPGKVLSNARDNDKEIAQSGYCSLMGKIMH